MRWLLVILVGFTVYHFLSKSFSGSEGVGKPLPPMAVQYLPGAEPYAPGRAAVVEFWATWCPPCRQSIPHLNSLHERSGDRLQVIGVTNEDAGTVEAFRKSVPMKYSVATDASGGLARHFGVRGIPHAVLVDAQGVVRWTGHPMALNEALIQSLAP